MYNSEPPAGVLPCREAKASIPRQLVTSNWSLRNSQEAVSISANWNKDAAANTSSTLSRVIVIDPRGAGKQPQRLNETWLEQAKQNQRIGWCQFLTQVNVIEDHAHGVGGYVIKGDAKVVRLA